MDIKSLMQQAQELQSKMKQAQEEAAQTKYEGSAGGGMVKVSISGAGVVEKVEVDPSVCKSDEKEVLEDLLVAAFNDAKNKSDEGSASAIKDITGGMNLPDGFKL